MRRVSCMTPSTSCTWNYWVQTKVQWYQSIASTPQRTAAITPTHGRRWVTLHSVVQHEPACICFFLIFVCVCLCWPAGFACVFWLWTWGEICPFPAPAEEHVFEWLFQHHVYWQLSGCQTNQNKPLTSLLRAWSSNTFVLRLMHKVWNIIKCKSRC